MDIQASLDFVLRCEEVPFSDRFYRLQFERFPELEGHFREVNLKHQGAMLTMALQVIVAHYQKPNRATENYLKVIGHRHYRRAIPGEDYQKFQDCLLESLAAMHGSEWTSELAEAWRDACQSATDTMLRGHTEEQLIY